MAKESPQALLPSLPRTTRQLLQDQVVAQKLNILPPRLVEVTGAEVFDDKANCAIRYVQNQSQVECKLCVGDVATAANFHFVLPGCSGTDKGDGGSIELSRYEGRVTVFSAGAVRLSTFEALAPEAY
jgi:hypothetical protein